MSPTWTCFLAGAELGGELIVWNPSPWAIAAFCGLPADAARAADLCADARATIRSCELSRLGPRARRAVHAARARAASVRLQRARRCFSLARSRPRPTDPRQRPTDPR